MLVQVRRARAYVHRGGRAAAFVRFRRHLRRTHGWDDDQLRAMQLRGLARLTRTLGSSSFQRERLGAAGLTPADLRSFEALAAIPPVTKHELVAAGLDALATVPPDRRSVRLKATSGSSGEPFRFLIDRHALDRGNAVRADVYERLGAPSGPVVELFDAALDGPGARGRRGHGTPGLDRRVIGYRLPVPEQADLVTRIAPTVLYGNRSHLLLVAEEIARRGTELSSVQLVVSSSEMLAESDRVVLKEVFGAEVHDVYGLAETEAVGWERVPGAGYHVVASRVVVEVLRDGVPVAPGEVGQVVVTSIDNQVMPFLRYATGDLARLPAEELPPTAGSTTLRLRQIEGRRADSLVRADGTIVSPWQASTSTFWGRPEVVAGCRQWQIDQHDDRSVTVSVVPAHEGLSEALVHEIEQFVGDAVGAEVTVRAVEEVDHDANGKFRAVRSTARPDGPASRGGPGTGASFSR